MANEVKLPRLGQGMEAGTITKWLKSPGDKVEKGEPLFEIDTDKVTQEVESDYAGVLLKITLESGEAPVGQTIAYIGKEGEQVAAAEEPAESADTEEPEDTGAEASAEKPAKAEERAPDREEGRRAAAEAAERVESSAAAPSNGGRIKDSPLARRIARERGIDLATLSGTGPDGRIVAEDVENASGISPGLPAQPIAPAAEVEVNTMTATRRTIARRLTEAWTAPVFQLGVSIDMTEALHLREQLVERLAEVDVKPTVNDLLTRFVGVALARNRALNATLVGDEIHRHTSAHVGMAVAAPTGLVVPVIRDADRRSVQEIARARAELVGRAREGKLSREDMSGGTFTISNLGMSGADEFVAVLNPPQVAILAVGAVKPTPVVVEGEVDVAPMMHATLTCDHRAIDVADGAEFLRTLVALVEQPALAL